MTSDGGGIKVSGAVVRGRGAAGQNGGCACMLALHCQEVAVQGGLKRHFWLSFYLAFATTPLMNAENEL
jgi:hypothetical protein